MMFRIQFLSIVILALLIFGVEPKRKKKEEDAKKFMEELDPIYAKECNGNMQARWNFTIDINSTETRELAVISATDYKIFQAEAGHNVSKYEKDSEKFENVNLYRQIRFFKDEGPAANSTFFDEYLNLFSEVVEVFEDTKICSYLDPENCTMTLSEVEYVMATSNDTAELEYYWHHWMNATGTRTKEPYLNFLSLVNQTAVNDGYKNAGYQWLNKYTVTKKEVKNESFSEINAEKIKTNIDNIMEKINDQLFKLLHTYVRMKLVERYPDEVQLDMPIPEHILGGLWSENWSNLYELVKPYPDEKDFDITEEMIEEEWSVEDMFIEAQQFFTDLSFPDIDDETLAKSIVNQSSLDSKILCTPEVVDMCLGESDPDFRVRMCAEITMEDLITAHKEMALVHYYKQYSTQPLVFREGANPGFLEAMQNVVELSVSNPKHLQDLAKSRFIQSNQKVQTNKEVLINWQMKMALEKLAYLPYAYIVDKFRWDIFSGITDEDNANVHWWNLKEKHQGVISPGKLRGSDYFDLGSNPFIATNKPAIDKFLGIVMGFQIHKSLCQKTEINAALYECDISGNQDIGKIIMDAMKVGFSVPWPEVYKNLTQSVEISPNGTIEYFNPLIGFLNETIAANKLKLGWESKIEKEVDLLKDQIKYMDENVTTYAVSSVEAQWNYNTNLTDKNAEAMNEASLNFTENYYHLWKNVINDSGYEYITDMSVRRQFDMQKSVGVSILSDEKLTQLNKYLTNMMEIYGSKVCPFDASKCDANSEGYDIDRLEREMATNREYPELLYYWENWRDVSGTEMIDDFTEYVKILNETAILNGFTDAGDMWINPYTSYGSDEYIQSDFKSEIEELWMEMKDNYKKLHAYVRFKLEKHEDYGKYIYEDGLIPAHILGNMWAQSWENIYDLVAPYPEEKLIDITESLTNWTEIEMFRTAEDFFTSIDLYKMTKDFWNKSMLVQPSDRKVVCHASAWDFYSTEIDNTKDGRYRIKMCTDKTQDDFITIHHEMGHIEYQMAYSNNKPLIYRDGANPGFHEAIGDTIALSVSTPDYLNVIFENDNTVENEEHQHINFLMQQALAKVAFLPYAYILDQWRWDIFKGNITSDEFNERWWEKRIVYQGIRPPIKRFRSGQLDAASKYHVPANVPYIRYFVSHILQFQFHEKLCKISGVKSEFSKCSIYKNKKAGKALKEMLEKGASEQWQFILQDFLEDSEASMSASAINEYFQPLWDFLDAELKKNNVTIGWDDTVLENYMTGSNETPPTVAIIVGVVLVVLVAIVLVAFFVGQNKRKKKDKKAMEAKERVVGEFNSGLEMDERS